MRVQSQGVVVPQRLTQPGQVLLSLLLKRRQDFQNIVDVLLFAGGDVFAHFAKCRLLGFQLTVQVIEHTHVMTGGYVVQFVEHDQRVMQLVQSSCRFGREAHRRIVLDGITDGQKFQCEQNDG
ncbi:hypothetical protein D3C76_945970 [compost metagenome]